MKKHGRGFIWTTQEEQKLKDIYVCNDINILSKIFNRSQGAIRKKAKNLGLKRDLAKKTYNRSWTIEEEQYLIDNYNSGNIKNIARYLNRTKKAISERAKILKIKRDTELIRINGHRYLINENYFKTWSDDMAYILGLIWTDGCMLDLDYHISITQHKKDKYILDNIYKALGSNKKPYRNKNTYNLSIHNKIIYNDLKNLGLVPRKSKTIKMPLALPDEFAFSFIRGVIDGDGTVNKRSGRIKVCTASTDFAKGLVELFKKFNIEHKLYNNPYVWRDKKKIKSEDIKEDDIFTDFYNLFIIKKSSIKKIYNFMYNDAKLYLVRKREIFKKLGVDNSNFDLKNKYLCRKIKGISFNTGETLYFDKVSSAKISGFPKIFQALKNGKAYKGYMWKYIG